MKRRDSFGLWWIIWFGGGLALNGFCPAIWFFSAMLAINPVVPVVSVAAIGLVLGIGFYLLNRVHTFMALGQMLVAANALGMSAAVYSLLFGLPLMGTGIVVPVLLFLAMLNLAMPTGVFLAYTIYHTYRNLRQVHTLATIS